MKRKTGIPGAKRKAKAALRRLSMTFVDLAERSGLALSTVHAVLCNDASSEKSKQAITNALGVEIWPGLLPNESKYVFPEGCQIELDDPQMARQFADEFTDHVRLQGRVITFLKATPCVFIFPHANELQAVDTGTGALGDKRRRRGSAARRTKH